MPDDSSHENPSGDELVIYRCSECGNISTSLGFLHGQMEKHHGFGPFNIFPAPRKTANPDALMEKTEVLRVDEYTEVELEGVEELD